jgi:hypothetical protein
VGKRLCFFKEHKGQKRGRFERVLAFWSVCDENSKYASEYPENVEVKELPSFNAVGKEAYQMLEKQVLCLRALALRLGR